MVVWGGAGFNVLDSGGLYDPTTDTWLPTSITTNTPLARNFHSAVWTGAEMLVFGGGYISGSIPIEFNDGGHYDPVVDAWRSMSTTNAPTVRRNHTAVWTGTEMIVWGGQYYQGGTWYRLADGARYWCNPN